MGTFRGASRMDWDIAATRVNHGAISKSRSRCHHGRPPANSPSSRTDEPRSGSWATQSTHWPV